MSAYKAWVQEQEDPQLFDGFRSRGTRRQQSRMGWINEGLKQYADWLQSLTPDQRNEHFRLQKMKDSNHEQDI